MGRPASECAPVVEGIREQNQCSRLRINKALYFAAPRNVSAFAERGRALM
jgi:hypothetical protein